MKVAGITKGPSKTIRAVIGPKRWNMDVGWFVLVVLL